MSFPLGGRRPESSKRFLNRQAHFLQTRPGNLKGVLLPVAAIENFEGEHSGITNRLQCLEEMPQRSDAVAWIDTAASLISSRDGWAG